LYYDHRLLLRETLLIGVECQNANDSKIYTEKSICVEDKWRQLASTVLSDKRFVLLADRT